MLEKTAWTMPSTSASNFGVKKAPVEQLSEAFMLVEVDAPARQGNIGG
jgi:hypothetical protein